MVARINAGKSIAKALNYNEQKVQQGAAQILSASGFIKTLADMNFYDKQQFFERHTSLNHQATTNVLHVSLNFDPSEKLDDDKMIAIANDYMKRIGFGDQPYLVYRHKDAGHPHLHVVSTNIKSTGERISMHRIGANQSEKARKEIEVAFKLVKAESKKMQSAALAPINATRVLRGKSEIKQAISNVLMQVLNQYKFTSLPELNAVLGLYNVTADRGDKDSKMYKSNGLVYRVLDEKGNKIGTPLKASLFYMKPTLKFLEQKFTDNEELKIPFKKKIQTAIAWALHKSPADVGAFVNALEKENISVVIRMGKQDVIYGLTYIDHKNKVVFNGSDLGKEFSAKAVLENFRQDLAVKEEEKISEKLNPTNGKEIIWSKLLDFDLKLPEAETTPLANFIPYALRKKKKSKKRRMKM